MGNINLDKNSDNNNNVASDEYNVENNTELQSQGNKAVCTPMCTTRICVAVFILFPLSLKIFNSSLLYGNILPKVIGILAFIFTALVVIIAIVGDKYYFKQDQNLSASCYGLSKLCGIIVLILDVAQFIICLIQQRG